MAGFMDALFLVYERWARDVPPFPAYLGPFTDPECQFIGADGEATARLIKNGKYDGRHACLDPARTIALGMFGTIMMTMLCSALCDRVPVYKLRMDFRQKFDTCRFMMGAIAMLCSAHRALTVTYSEALFATNETLFVRSLDFDVTVAVWTGHHMAGLLFVVVGFILNYFWGGKPDVYEVQHRVVSVLTGYYCLASGHMTALAAYVMFMEYGVVMRKLRVIFEEIGVSDMSMFMLGADLLNVAGQLSQLFCLAVIGGRVYGEYGVLGESDRAFVHATTALLLAMGLQCMDALQIVANVLGGGHRTPGQAATPTTATANTEAKKDL